MERAVLLAAATWIGGVGAWAVGAGYALAEGGHMLRPSSRALSTCMVEEDAPVEVDVLPAPRPPQELDAPPSEPAPAPSSELTVTRGPDGELQLIKPDDFDSSALLTESQRRRLAPVNSLKRKRRSRKVRVAGESTGKKFVPLVAGARPSTDESILAAFSGDTLASKREQGEDYYVDPLLLQDEIEREAQISERRKSLKLKKDAYKTDKLKQELAAPYKNNVIGAIVIGVGVMAVFFAAFPGLLEENLAPSIASFPDQL